MGGQQDEPLLPVSQDVSYLLIPVKLETDVTAAGCDIIPIDKAFPLAEEQFIHIEPLPESAMVRKTLPDIYHARGDHGPVEEQIVEADEIEQPIRPPEAE
jgi:hypothetical protein